MLENKDIGIETPQMPDINEFMVERDKIQTEVVQADPDFKDRVSELAEIVDKVLVIDFSDFCDYLLSLEKANRLKATAELGNVFNSCIGGIIRSPKISKIMSLFGCRFANAACVRGYRIQQLLQDIAQGEVDQNKIKPQGCKSPIDTLFIDIDNNKNSDVNALGSLTAPLARLSNGEKLNLTLVVFLSEEDTIKSIVDSHFPTEKERLFILDPGIRPY